MLKPFFKLAAMLVHLLNVLPPSDQKKKKMVSLPFSSDKSGPANVSLFTEVV